MTATAEPTSTVKGAKSEKPGASWKGNEEHVLPKNRIGMVFFGLMACVFLAALDQVCSCSFISNNLILSHIPLDYRSHSFAHDRSGTWRG
jgi:hypothetical protein